mmetsp:Transcript_24463/g.73235  ORF Transcript_24463/g.73235 Transcript_24463/m.73235 type:complete len:136 (+) Transcript_24463:24-431(+)
MGAPRKHTLEVTEAFCDSNSYLVAFHTYRLRASITGMYRACAFVEKGQFLFIGLSAQDERNAKIYKEYLNSVTLESRSLADCSTWAAAADVRRVSGCRAAGGVRINPVNYSETPWWRGTSLAFPYSDSLLYSGSE